MPKQRDTFTYDLRDGRKVVYKGTTNDLERRVEEHWADGKRFSSIAKTSPRMTEEESWRCRDTGPSRHKCTGGGETPRRKKEIINP